MNSQQKQAITESFLFISSMNNGVPCDKYLEYKNCLKLKKAFPDMKGRSNNIMDFFIAIGEESTKAWKVNVGKELMKLINVPEDDDRVKLDKFCADLSALALLFGDEYEFDIHAEDDECFKEELDDIYTEFNELIN